MGIRDDDDEPIVIESAARRLANHSSGGMTSMKLPEGLQLWKPKKTGSHTIDIIPYKVTEAVKRFSPTINFASVGTWTYERTFFTHPKVGVNNSSYVCLAKTTDRDCPICQAMRKHQNSPAKEDTDRARELKPKQRQMFLIYDHDATDRGVQLWELANWNFGKHLDEYINGARKQDIAAYQRFFDPVEGFTIRITAHEEAIGAGNGRGAGVNVVYKVHQFYPRERPLPKSVIRHGFDLNTIPVILDYAKLKNVFDGVAEDEDVIDRAAARATRLADQDDDPPPRASRRHEDDEDERPTRTERRRVEDDAPPPRAERERPRAARDEDDEPAADADAPIEFASGDVVEYTYRGQKESGPIISIDRERRVAAVKIEGQERPRRMGLEELTLVERDDTFDKKPEPKKVAKDEEKADSKPRTRGRKPEDDKADEKPRAKARDEDDDRDRDEKPRSRKSWGDDDEDDDRTASAPPSRRK